MAKCLALCDGFGDAVRSPPVVQRANWGTSACEPRTDSAHLAAFTPDEREIEVASEIIEKAENAEWAPISFEGRLHDRASYRYFWQTLERAHQTGRALPAGAQAYFATGVH
jgi:hypothetical protein